MSNPSSRFIADTSAVINLIATQFAAEILSALPERAVVVDVAASELDGGRKNGRPDADMLADLQKAGLVEVVGLGERGELLFEQLVAGAASETLDDGEAATIAYAAETSLGIVMDDGKARRICRERFSGMPMRSSVEIFQHASLHQVLGRQQMVKAVVNALRIGRMRVFPEHLAWVLNLIGDENASACSSLPSRSRRTVSPRI